MADSKLTGLTAYTGQVASDELMYVVEDPSGSPVSKKATRLQVSPFELIADSGAISSSAAFQIDADPNDFSKILVHAEEIVADTANFFGLEATDGSYNVLWSIISNGISSALGTTEKFSMRAEGTAVSSYASMWFGQYVTDAVKTSGGLFSSEFVEELGSASKMKFVMYATSTPVTMTAGRIRVYGIRKP